MSSERRAPEPAVRGRRNPLSSAARSVIAGGPIAAVVVAVGGAEHVGVPLSETVTVVAVVSAFLLSIAHLGRLFRQDGQAHAEAMRALDVRETEIRCRAVVDSGDRRWTDEELRLLLAVVTRHVVSLRVG